MQHRPALPAHVAVIRRRARVIRRDRLGPACVRDPPRLDRAPLGQRRVGATAEQHAGLVPVREADDDRAGGRREHQHAPHRTAEHDESCGDPVRPRVPHDDGRYRDRRARAPGARPRLRPRRGVSGGRDRIRPRGARLPPPRRVGDAREGVPREPAVRRLPRDARTRRRPRDRQVGDLLPPQSRARPADRHRRDLRLRRHQRRAADAARRPIGHRTADRRRRRRGRAGARRAGRADRRPDRVRAARRLGGALPRGRGLRTGRVLRPVDGRCPLGGG